MLATIPALIARQIREVRPHLRIKPVPLEIPSAYSELLWPRATDDDAPCTFVRTKILELARAVARDIPRG